MKKLNERLDKKQGELIVISDKLLETESMYKSIMNASPDAITVINSDGEIVMASPSAKKIFGVVNEDIIGRAVTDFVSQNNHSKIESNMNRIIRGEKVGPSEYEALHNDGHIFSIEVNSDLIIDSNKGENKVLSVIKDITDKIISEEIIRKKEEKYRLLVKELEEKNNILNKVAINDKLTGINNRYYFDKRIIETIFKEGEYEILENKLSDLLEHLEYHFDYEDSLLRELGYPYEYDHRMLHVGLLKKTKNLIEKQKKVGNITHADIFEFIVGELVVEHLVKEDTKFFGYLN